MNAKISVFAICVKTIIYLLLYDLHDCTFKYLFSCIKLWRFQNARIFSGVSYQYNYTDSIKTVVQKYFVKSFNGV